MVHRWWLRVFLFYMQLQYSGNVPRVHDASVSVYMCVTSWLNLLIHILCNQEKEKEENTIQRVKCISVAMKWEKEKKRKEKGPGAFLYFLSACTWLQWELQVWSYISHLHHSKWILLPCETSFSARTCVTEAYIIIILKYCFRLRWPLASWPNFSGLFSSSLILLSFSTLFLNLSYKFYSTKKLYSR